MNQTEYLILEFAVQLSPTLFRKDRNYAYLRKFSDYEHYALLCRHLQQPNRYPGKDEKC